MREGRRTYIFEVLFYNCLALAIAVAAFALSLWLASSGRLRSEGVDALLLFAVGLVTGGSFMAVPVKSIREGLLRDALGAWRAATPRVLKAAPRRQAPWRESPAH